MFGSLMGTPIINLPQTGEPPVIVSLWGTFLKLITAVLGLHATKQKPVAIDGKVEIRPASHPPLRFPSINEGLIYRFR